MPAKLADAGLERDPRSRRGLVEDQRHRALGQHVAGQRGRFELARALEQRPQFRRAQLCTGDEVAWQAAECTLAVLSLSVLTWNLKHGRAFPSAGRDLFDEFAAALAGWDWDVALLQEVPPWWPSRLGARLQADWRLVLTSRHFELTVLRAPASRAPDAIKSSGCGCNALLVRRGSGTATASIAEHRVLRLTWLPERRWLLGVR